MYCYSDLPLTSSDDSSSRGFLGLLVRLVMSAAFKEKGSFSRIWSTESKKGQHWFSFTHLGHPPIILFIQVLHNCYYHFLHNRMRYFENNNNKKNLQSRSGIVKCTHTFIVLSLYYSTVLQKCANSKLYDSMCLHSHSYAYIAASSTTLLPTIVKKIILG